MQNFSTISSKLRHVASSAAVFFTQNTQLSLRDMGCVRMGDPANKTADIMKIS